jgi:hypothetical protein
MENERKNGRRPPNEVPPLGFSVWVVWEIRNKVAARASSFRNVSGIGAPKTVSFGRGVC